jgi:AmmeMemoRadiSam system protein B
MACGGGPAIAVAIAAQALGASDARVLKYAHSGEVSGDNSGVVGYLGAAFGTFRDAD